MTADEQLDAILSKVQKLAALYHAQQAELRDTEALRRRLQAAEDKIKFLTAENEQLRGEMQNNSGKERALRDNMVNSRPETRPVNRQDTQTRELKQQIDGILMQIEACLAELSSEADD